MRLRLLACRLLAGAILVLVAGCNGLSDYRLLGANAAEADGSLSPRFFAVAFDQIQDKYLNPITASRIAEAGLAGLNRIDDRIEIRRNGARIEAREGGEVFAGFDAPPDGDARRWGQLTTEVVEAVRVRSQKIRESSTDAIYQAVMEGAVAQLDPYSRYANPELAREGRASRDGFGGIGVTVDTQRNDVRVRTIQPESPASRAGLRVDDRIVEIDRQSTTGMNTRDIVRRLRGPIGTPVEVAISRGAAREPSRFVLVRQLIVPVTVTYRRDGNLAHIRLIGFNQRTTEAMTDVIRQARREIPNLQGIVLDLRGNLGGLLDQSIAVADMFLNSGEIVSTRGRHRQAAQVSYARGGAVAEGVPVVVLVNGNSASASEIVAAALQDQGRGIVVGTVSFGKGSVQTVIPLPNEGELFLTWARFHAPSGYPLEDLGVLPLVCTSGPRSNVNQIVNDIRSGRMTSVSSMASWRAADHSNMARLNQLRQTCPPETTERELDVEVARRLLADRTLYQRALGSARATAQRHVPQP